VCDCVYARAYAEPQNFQLLVRLGDHDAADPSEYALCGDKKQRVKHRRHVHATTCL